VIREALNYPPSGEHGSRAVLVGGLLFVVLTAVGVVSWLLLEGDPSVAFVPVGVVALWFSLEKVTLALVAVTIPFLCIHIVFRGYYVAVLRASSEVDPAAPPFPGIQVVIDGIKYVVVLFIYFLPAVVLGGFGLSIQIVSSPGVGGTLINTVGAFAFLFGLFAFIAAAYLVPAAITLFARESSLRAAFGLSTVRTCALTEDYAVGWVLATLMLLVFTPIAVLLDVLLVGFFLRFYLRVSVNHVYALAVANALDLVEHEHNTTTDENSIDSTEGMITPRK
jgi:hypothetical protein